MGLTIHYSIEAPGDWTTATIRTKLKQARKFAMSLPVQSVSEQAVFRGKEADFHHVRDAGLEEQDSFFWAKIQAQRSLCNPWKPGSIGSQPPSCMAVFSVLPAEGCEQMNIGICSYPEHVWKAEGDDPAWSLALTRSSYPESEKLLRTFLRRWKLRKLPRRSNHHFGPAESLVHYSPMAQASIYKGRYLSHRRGYAGAFGLVTLRDRMEHELCFRFMGNPEEAKKVFSSKQFQADLQQLVTGVDHITPAVHGVWSSFCKTQYANDPRCGGWKNFIQAHLAVLAILEHLAGLGFKVHVRDEGGFWEHRDFGKLAEVLGEYDTLVAGLAGAVKDALGKHGLAVESAMSGRPDFERLEMKAQGTLGEMLKRIAK